MRQIVRDFLQPRRDAPIIGYTPFTLIVAWFFLNAIDLKVDDGSEIVLGVLLLLCVLQMFFRIVLGWLAFLLLSTTVTLLIAVLMDARHVRQFLVNLSVCTVSTIAVWVFRPKPLLRRAATTV
jgi:hypothetical protein